MFEATMNEHFKIFVHSDNNNNKKTFILETFEMGCFKTSDLY